MNYLLEEALHRSFGGSGCFLTDVNLKLAGADEQITQIDFINSQNQNVNLQPFDFLKQY